MSEIKGQVLGIVLVIVLFGVIATAMKSAFTTYSSQIDDSVTEVTKMPTPAQP